MTDYKCSLLVVDDEPYILATLVNLLSNEFHVMRAGSVEEAKARFAVQAIDVVLSDQRMPRSTGVELLEWVRQHSPKTVRLLMTGFAELEEAVDAINRGGVFRYIFKPWRAEELLETLRSAARTFKLERSNELLLDQLQQLNQDLERRVEERTHALAEANHELEQKNKMLEKLALTDPLTGLPNRRAMDRLAERELRRRERYPGALAIGLVDVDHFKFINDRYLLPGGDQVLIDLARCLLASMRTVDFLGRIGGEEFLAIAPETDCEGATALGERIRGAVQDTAFIYQEDRISVTVSVGFAVAEVGTYAEYEHMKHLAAAALAEAKMRGRNRTVVHPASQQVHEASV